MIVTHKIVDPDLGNIYKGKGHNITYLFMYYSLKPLDKLHYRFVR